MVKGSQGMETLSCVDADTLGQALADELDQGRNNASLAGLILCDEIGVGERGATRLEDSVRAYSRPAMDHRVLRLDEWQVSGFVGG